MNKRELLWRYIDGACSPEERAEAERLLAEDAAFKLEWAQCQKLHQSLKEQPLEQPSLRFARNLMERLPVLYRKLNIQPLFTPVQWRVLYGALGVFLAGYFYLFYIYVDSGVAAPSNPILDSTVQTLNNLPSQIMAVLAALSFGFITLVWLDKQLKRRFG